MNHIGWAVLGMAGYSATTLFVKLATRDGELSGYRVLVLAVTVVFVSIWSFTLATGGGSANGWRGLTAVNAAWSLAAGAVLAIAVFSLFRALSLGPASVVVPIYGMFIVGGAVLGMVFLGESVTVRKLAGLALAVIGVVLIAR